ncbi:NAD-dependent epimerase/dehydratase family protein [Dyadobacter arcticus]|uniref:dTDP-glucose 4,6-dehydratase/UDP-glucose 4-epimerase n=1 Tax=Dyadobacter arcticus TaxID=1078754 RepID=A0ABX0UGD2_9BACT|nr:SDR family oxidoreductase [Dyadobacter arcticus]NIJ51568.1 dTDP-glucose 4,6-dehydratase/UDP-glucose 4-epimerase [Dyadobacter arcticus]
MKILVIGSKGFIGSHVASFFKLIPDSTVFECDVMVDYEKDNYFLIDSTNSDYHTIFQNTAFDVCINCSGAASVPDSIKNPFRDFTLNTYNVVKMLDSIRTNQPGCKFINLSSAAVYGNPAEIPIHENLPLNPISPYGIHKMQAEQVCQTYSRFYDIPTCSLRIFSAYGNGLKKQLFWDLFQKAKKGHDIELFGTGQETRDFIHADDVSKAILCCQQKAEFKGEVINVANGEETTIGSAVEIFYSFFQGTKKVHFNGMVKKGDPLNWRADISKLKGMGYVQSVDLYDGLLKYYLWISQL